MKDLRILSPFPLLVLSIRFCIFFTRIFPNFPSFTLALGFQYRKSTVTRDGRAIIPGVNALPSGGYKWRSIGLSVRIVSHIYRYLIIKPFDSDAVEFELIEYGETRCHAMTLSAVYCFYHTGSL